MFTVTWIHPTQPLVNYSEESVENLGAFATDPQVVDAESFGWIYYIRNEVGGLILTNDPDYLTSNFTTPVDWEFSRSQDNDVLF